MKYSGTGAAFDVSCNQTIILIVHLSIASCCLLPVSGVHKWTNIIIIALSDMK